MPPPSDSNAEPKPVLDIPAFGPDALPTVTGKNGAPLTNEDTNWPPAYHLLKQYTDQHPDNPYVAVVGIWNNEKDRYEYKALPLDFPEEMVDVSNGRMAHYAYRLNTSDNGIYRTLAAVIPPYRTAEAMMNRWLKFEHPELLATDSSKTSNATNSTNSLDIRSGAAGNIDYLSDDGCFVATDPYTGDFLWGWCEEVTVTADGPSEPEVYDPEWPLDDENPHDDGPGGGDDGGGCGLFGCGDDEGGGWGDFDDTEYEIDLWEAQIDDSELAPCMQDELADLKQIEEGVGEIVAKFKEGNAPEYNWKVKNGDTGTGENATTDTEYNATTNTVTTIFDTDKFKSASNLAIIRTLIHEAVHAYFISLLYHSDLGYRERRDLAGDNWDYAAFGESHDTHGFIAENYISDITKSLQDYGISKGYSYDEDFYEYLAWGGLTEYKNEDTDKFEETPFFVEAYSNPDVREEIRDVIQNELNGKNNDGSYGGGQKGQDGGC